MSELRPCPLCHGSRAGPFLDSRKYSTNGVEYQVASCSDCGLLYTRPVPDADEFRLLYDQSYMPYRIAGSGFNIQKPALLSVAWLTEMFHRTVQWERRLALRGSRPARILDVGCGVGDFLGSLAHLGWETYGTEISEAGAGLARARGIRAYRGELTAAGFPDDFFDVVTLWHVLEHVPDPLAQLAEIRRILKPEGLLVVEVPNARSATFSLTKEKWYYLDVPRHLQHFTPATLDAILGQAGFRKTARRDLHLWDFTVGFYSFMESLGLRQRLVIEFFSADFKSAPLFSKLAFLFLGSLIALLCLPYTLFTTLAGRGEVMTVTAVKKGDPSPQHPEPPAHPAEP
jgi:2-polyprenyl-3-methyl-5-hydroxy-6-metoxy-1,4-benzoquinol methylase